MNQKRIGIVNYQLNNLFSVEKGLRELKIEFDTIDQPDQVKNYSHVILPGVGSFLEGAQKLKKSGFRDALRENHKAGNFLLGICLGMQLLFDESDEFESHEKGLGLFAGRCEKLEESPGINVPHIGWNKIVRVNNSKILDDETENKDFYFVHSFHVLPEEERVVTSRCLHGNEFVATVEFENLFGCQFHPEKSYTPGFSILRKFTEMKL